MKSFFCDVETTGLSEHKNAIWQLAYIVVDNKGGITHKDVVCMKPTKGAEINQEALKIGGIIEEDLSKFLQQLEVYNKFLALIDGLADKFDSKDKMLFYAYNSPFDMNFIRQWFYKNNNKFFGSYFWFPDICIMRLAADYIGKDRPKLKDFKQNTVARHLGIEVDKGRLHDALYDIELSMEIYKIVKGGE